MLAIYLDKVEGRLCNLIENKEQIISLMKQFTVQQRAAQLQY